MAELRGHSCVVVVERSDDREIYFEQRSPLLQHLQVGRDAECGES